MKKNEVIKSRLPEGWGMESPPEVWRKEHIRGKELNYIIYDEIEYFNEQSMKHLSEMLLELEKNQQRFYPKPNMRRDAKDHPSDAYRYYFGRMAYIKKGNLSPRGVD